MSNLPISDSQMFHQAVTLERDWVCAPTGQVIDYGGPWQV